MNDLKFALRQLLKHPGFTAVAVLTLALGIGANTAIYSVVNAVLFRPLPYQAPEQLVIIGESNSQRGIQQMIVRAGNLFDWREQTTTFADFAAEVYESFNVSGEATPDHVHASRVTANYFEVLGAKPHLGRSFFPDEDQDGREGVTILSHRYWQRQFGGDAGVLGKVIRLNGMPHFVVGVMPESFRSFNPTTVYGRPTAPMEPELWVPYPFTTADRAERRWPLFLVLGRMKPGVTLDQASADLAAVADRSAQTHEAQRSWSVKLTPLHAELVSGVRSALLTLLGAVGFVLLIACANLANLALARSVGRRREFALRAALGAGWACTARLLLVEGLVLAVVGALAGLLVATGLTQLITKFGPAGVLRLEETSFDARVLVFMLAISGVTALFGGLAPFATLRRARLTELLNESSRTGSSGREVGVLRSTLVVSQVALALMLFVGAGLLIRSFQRLAKVDPGFRPEQLLAFDFTLPDPQYSEESKRLGVIAQVLERIESLPGVRLAATAYGLPFSTMLNAGTAVTIEGRAGHLDEHERIVVGHRQASARYFETMGIPILRGRAFVDSDNQTAPRVVIVNESFARLHFQQADPVGRRVSFGSNSSNWCEIVGVIRDVRLTGLDAESRPEIYQPHQQSALWMFSVVVRTDGREAGLAHAVAESVSAVDRGLPAYNQRLLDADVARTLGPRRFAFWLLGAFAALALGLAAAGIYGVMSFVVGQRQRELGIRLALGAQRRDVWMLILGQGGRLIMIGMFLGLPGAFAVRQMLAHQLYSITATDHLVIGGASMLLLLVALAGCWLPARRAARVDPMVALRTE